MKTTKENSASSGPPPLATRKEAVKQVNEMGVTFIPGPNNAIVVVDPTLSVHTGPLRIQSLKAAHEFYAPKVSRVATGTGKEIDGFTIWARHAERREADGIIYEPSKPPGAIIGNPPMLNAWCGYSVAPKTPHKKEGREAIELYQEHLRDVICSGRETEFQYVWRWLAWNLQHPSEVPGVALLLYSTQGTGKGHMLQPLLDLHGHHGLQLTSKNSLLGKFNSALAGKRLVFADEAAFWGDPRIRDQLKGMITEPSLEIEKKFVDRIQVKNIAAFVFATNHQNLHIEAQDRRVFPLEVSDARVGDHKYFQRLREACAYPQFLSGLLYTLLREELKNFHPQSHRPKTNEYREQVFLNLRPFERWSLERLTTGSLQRHSHPGSRSQWPSDIATQDLLGDFRWFCEEHRLGDRIPELEPRVFGKKLKKAWGIKGLTRPGGPAGRERRYVLQSLAKTRRAFEECLRHPIAWDEWGGGEVINLPRRSKGSEPRARRERSVSTRKI